MDRMKNRSFRAASAFALALCGGLALTLLGGLGAPAADAKQKLSCTFISKQCRKECSKKVDAVFCDGYCSDLRQQCLRTGRWDGISRQFTDVRRR